MRSDVSEALVELSRVRRLRLQKYDRVNRADVLRQKKKRRGWLD